MKLFERILILLLIVYCRSIIECKGQVYCDPSNLLGCNNGYITSVTDGNLINNSTCGIQGYSDFSALVFPMIMGEYNYISTSLNWGGQNNNACCKFIDWNYDGDFDDIYESQSQYSGQEGIFVPLFVTIGNNYKMRISNYWQACNNDGRESEDYTINVLPSLSCPTPYLITANQIQMTSVELGWSYSSNNPPIAFYIKYRKITDSTNVSSWQNPISTIDQFYTLNNLSPGTNYIVEVAADCSTNGVSNYSFLYNFTTTPEPFIDVLPYSGSSIQGDGISLSIDGYDIFSFDFSYSIDGGNTYQSWSSAIPFTNNYIWVPIPPSGNVTIKVDAFSNIGGVFSDTITINVEPVVLSITYPISGEEILRDDNFVINWESNVNINQVSYNNIDLKIKEINNPNWLNFIGYNFGSLPSINQIDYYNSVLLPWNNLQAGDYIISIIPTYGEGDTSIVPFSIKDIIILNPNGGEILTAGSTVGISAKSNFDDTYTLQFSSDGGLNWIDLTSNFVINIADSLISTYFWTVPNISSNHCLIRLTKQNVPGVTFDKSNGEFSIVCSTNSSIQPISNLSVCQGDSVHLLGPNGSGLNYQWFKNGIQILNTNDPNFYATENGIYSLQLNSNGCISYSDSVEVNIMQTPIAPVISTNLDSVLLFSNYSYGNQWFLNNNMLINDTLNFIVNNSMGIYTVCYTDSNSCTSCSNPFLITSNKMNEQLIDYILSPNPFSSFIILQKNNECAEITKIEIVNCTGQIVFSEDMVISTNKINLISLSNGIYFLRLRELNGKTLNKRIVKCAY